MALPPDTADSFVREVDENLRRDQAADFAKRYGALIAAAVVLFLLAVAGFLYWQNRQRAAAEAATEQLATTLQDVGAGRGQAAPTRLQALEQSDADGVRATAALSRAALALQKNDRKAAATIYAGIAADSGLAKPYRDLATLRSVAVRFEQLPPQQVIDRLKPLATPGNPWFGSAGELVAMAYLKQGKQNLAGPLFAAIAKDEDVPVSLRSRTRQMAGLLGYDAVVDVDETLAELRTQESTAGAPAPAAAQ